MWRIEEEPLSSHKSRYYNGKIAVKREESRCEDKRGQHHGVGAL
jgi:hypothetical protein